MEFAAGSFVKHIKRKRDLKRIFHLVQMKEMPRVEAVIWRDYIKQIWLTNHQHPIFLCLSLTLYTLHFSRYLPQCFFVQQDSRRIGKSLFPFLVFIYLVIPFRHLFGILMGFFRHIHNEMPQDLNLVNTFMVLDGHAEVLVSRWCRGGNKGVGGWKPSSLTQFEMPYSKVHLVVCL